MYTLFIFVLKSSSALGEEGGQNRILMLQEFRNRAYILLGSRASSKLLCSTSWRQQHACKRRYTCVRHWCCLSHKFVYDWGVIGLCPPCTVAWIPLGRWLGYTEASAEQTNHLPGGIHLAVGFCLPASCDARWALLTGVSQKNFFLMNFAMSFGP